MTNYSLAKHKSNTSELKLSNDPKIWLALLAFCEKNIIRYVVLVMSMMPVLSYISDFVVPFLYIILITLCMIRVRNVGFAEIGVLAFTVLAIIGTWAFYPDNAKYLFDSNNFWNTIFPCLRWFIVALAFVPTKENMNLLGKVSCVSVLVETIFVIAYMMPNGLLESDDMSRAYQLLPNILLVFAYAFNEKKFWAWVFSALGVLYLLALGTRGPIMIMLMFIFLKFLKNSYSKMWKKVFLGCTLAGVGLVFINLNLYVGILEYIKDVFSNFSLSTRIIDFALEGNIISYTSGRDELIEVAIQKINEQPLLGYGVYGEWQFFNYNAHNMFLEIFLHYGLVLGGVLLLWVINLVRKAYFSSHNTYSQDLIMIFACFVFVRGIFGGSYLMFGMYFLIGFCIKEIRRANRQKYAS